MITPENLISFACGLVVGLPASLILIAAVRSFRGRHLRETIAFPVRRIPVQRI